MQLCDALQAVRQLATKYSASDDVFYDIDISMEHILDYIKHIMQDSQQKKAKIDAFEKIDDETGFWLKDFCQKILPQKFREGQKE